MPDSVLITCQFLPVRTVNTNAGQHAIGDLADEGPISNLVHAGGLQWVIKGLPAVAGKQMSRKRS